MSGTLINSPQSNTRAKALLQESAQLPVELAHFDCFVTRWKYIVRRYGHNIAVECGKEALSYAELASNVEKFREELCEQLEDVRGQGVGIRGPINAKAIALQVAILCEGGYFVSLGEDANSPKEQQLIIDAELSLVVDTAPCRFQAAAKKVDECERRSPGALFCTSGSTGVSKRVLFPVTCLLQDIARQTETLHLNAGDRIDLLFKPSFSASLAPVYGALLNGATLCIADLHKLGVERLGRWLREQRISISTMSASTLKTLLHTLASDDSKMPNLRLISSGGEVMTREIVSSFRIFFKKSCILQNAYAMTETRTLAEFFIHGDDEDEETENCLGWPVAGKQLELISETGECIKTPGNMGEIRVKSNYIPEAYFKASTADDSFSIADDGEVSFLTGDMGYWDGQGRLHWSGRRDDLIKIRGRRISLTEIENLIYQLNPGLVYQLEWIAEKLVLFVPEEASSGTGSKLQHELHDKLPDYLHPIHVLFIDEWPRLHTGKVDRVGLQDMYLKQAPSPLRVEGRSEGRLEKSLRAIIYKHTGRSDFCAETELIEMLGVDSLQAASIAYEIGKMAPSPFHQSHLVEHGTLRKISAYLSSPTIVAQQKASVDFIHISWLYDSPLWYKALQEKLGDTVNLKFQNFSFQNSEKKFLPLREIAKICADELLAQSSNQLFCLCGYSFAGLIAYETAVVLEKRGMQAPVILLDTHTYERKNLWRLATDDMQTAGQRARELFFSKNKKRLKPFLKKALSRYQVGKYRAEKTTAHRKGSINAQLDHAMGFALRDYTPSHSSCAITVLHAENTSELKKASNFRWNYDWEKYAFGKFQRIEIPGTSHYSLMQAQWGARLAELIGQVLRASHR